MVNTDTTAFPKYSQKDDQHLLTEEFRQAWDHYRHLEELRVKYVTIAVSTFLAAMALNGLLIRIDFLGASGHSSFETNFIAFVSNIIVILVSIKMRNSLDAIRPVLSRYQAIINRIRSLVYADQKMESFLDAKSAAIVENRGDAKNVHTSLRSMINWIIGLMMVLEIFVIVQLFVKVLDFFK